MTTDDLTDPLRKYFTLLLVKGGSNTVVVFCFFFLHYSRLTLKARYTHIKLLLIYQITF